MAQPPTHALLIRKVFHYFPNCNELYALAWGFVIRPCPKRLITQ